MYEQIPQELRVLDQWVAVDMSLDANGEPKKLPLNPKTGRTASVVDRATWGSFDQAVKTGKPIGFVFSDEDPYAFIDLDDPYHLKHKDWSDEKRQHCANLNGHVYATFKSYAELSVSGNGVHIICKGVLPDGGRRDTVEAYTSGRYAIFTGKVIRDVPITENQSLLSELYAEIKKGQVGQKSQLIQVDGELDDDEIVERAMSADNADKFNALCSGDWQTDYPSQSEADLALLSIIAFYTPDNDQVRRIFRMTALGKREKAQKNDKTIDYALGKIRGKEPPSVDFTRVPAIPAPPVLAPVKVIAGAKDDSSMFPPGIIGEVAEYIYASAPRPVREVALLGAIALCAGLIGRSYNVWKSGLNQYLILMGGTGIGKEGASMGIDRLIAAARVKCPDIVQFQGPENFSSGQALMRTLDKRPCFFSVMGEFGITLHQISDPKAADHRIEFRKILLRLYSRSGWKQSQQASAYSDEEKNTSIVQAPNVTLFGEATQSSLLEKMTEDHIMSGLLSRFSIIEYTGLRPPLNEGHGFDPSPELAEKVAFMGAQALYTAKNCTCQDVPLDTEADDLQRAFNQECDTLINAKKGGVVSELWNRAHIKVLKLSALVAVGVNPITPVINREYMEWAIAFVKRDVHTILAKFEDGETSGVNEQEDIVRKVIREYGSYTPEQRKGYGVTAEKLLTASTIPEAYIRRRLRQVNCFRNAQQGPALAIKQVLADMVAQRILLSVSPTQMKNQFGSETPGYVIGAAF